MSVASTFGARLKELRETHKDQLTQVQLAEKLGVSRASIGFYEKAERTPDIEFLKRTAEFFEVSYNYLLGKSNAKKQENHETVERFGLSETTIDRLEYYKQNGHNDSLNKILQSDEFLISLDRIKELSFMYANRVEADVSCVIRSLLETEHEREHEQERLQELTEEIISINGPTAILVAADYADFIKNRYINDIKTMIDGMFPNMDYPNEEYQNQFDQRFKAKTGFNQEEIDMHVVDALRRKYGNT